MKKTTTKMKAGGKATAKPKMKAGGATKKKYALGSTVMNTETCLDGVDPGSGKCKQKKKFGAMQFPGKREQKKRG
jgi:hypothetical protein